MTTVACICAREGSKRLPGKALREINGTTLLGHAIAQARKASGTDDLVVSTDGAQIARVAEHYGVRTIWRPEELATDTASKWDVFRHVLKATRADMLVDLDVGCPMRIPEDVEACILALRTCVGAEVAHTAYEADRNPYFNMVELRKSSFASLVCGSPKPIVNGQDAPKVYALSPAVVAMWGDALSREHWSWCKMRLHIVPRWRGWDIDTEFDLRVAEFLMAERETNV
jgi:CMP-N-acetylneuraminic acid synthetase